MVSFFDMSALHMTTADFSAEAFFRLPSNKRYDDVIHAIKKGHSIYTLADSQGCLLIELDKEKVLPIWPTAELAKDWGNKDYPDFQSLEVSASDWSEKWLEGMQKDGYSVGVAPNFAGECIVSSAEEHQSDIKA